jgi:cellulose biosynthesis protein BcsQ
MLPVTFYSYKGGVGRTMALLNVAASLASRGHGVAVVDLDLEAPGLGLSASTRPETPQHRGVSDLLFDLLDGKDEDIEHYGYVQKLGMDELFIMPAGSRPSELAGLLPSLYDKSDSEAAYAFSVMLQEIDKARRPDFILIDSRTGRADIAGVATMQLPSVLVAVCGLNDQNVHGMKGALDAIWGYHDAENRNVLTLLAASPVPRLDDLREEDRGEAMSVLRQAQGGPEAQRLVELSANPLVRACRRFGTELVTRVERRLAKMQPSFPEVKLHHVVHSFEYDPYVPLGDELLLGRPGSLSRAYRRLASTLLRASGATNVADDVSPPPDVSEDIEHSLLSLFSGAGGR